MFCPQCGIESSDGQHYCRSCGTNLRVVGKAVTLSDAFSKTDGVPAKVKEIVSNIKIAEVTEGVSRAVTKMNRKASGPSSTDPAVQYQQPPKAQTSHSWRRREKTAEERRERHLTKGAVKFFTGGGLSIFLYFLFHAIELRLPPEAVSEIPFAIEPVVRILWTIGLIPMLSGVGHVIAGLSIPRSKAPQIEPASETPLRIDSPPAPSSSPDPEQTVVSVHPRGSVTEHTTNILERDASWREAR